jgi:hypothetical protein
LVGTHWTAKMKPLRVRGNQLVHTRKCNNNSVDISRRSVVNRFFTGNVRRLPASSSVFENSWWIFCRRPSRHTHNPDIFGRHCVCQRPSAPLARVFVSLWIRLFVLPSRQPVSVCFRSLDSRVRMRKDVDHVSVCVFWLIPSGVYSCLCALRPRLVFRHHHTVTCCPASFRLQRSPPTASSHRF